VVRAGADVGHHPRRQGENEMQRDIVGEVRQIIREQLDVDEAAIKLQSSFIDDLGADSLAIMELVLKFEEAFGINIPESETEKIRTVEDAIQYIQLHAAA
jgi:acyl carrier protein